METHLQLWRNPYNLIFREILQRFLLGNPLKVLPITYDVMCASIIAFDWFLVLDGTNSEPLRYLKATCADVSYVDWPLCPFQIYYMLAIFPELSLLVPLKRKSPLKQCPLPCIVVTDSIVWFPKIVNCGMYIYICTYNVCRYKERNFPVVVEVPVVISCWREMLELPMSVYLPTKSP